MADIDFDALYGLVPSGEGAEEQETAAPADEGKPEGGEAFSPADGISGVKEASAAKKTRSEEDARFAAARRKAEAERDLAVAAVRRQADEDQRQIFEAIGMNNPYTGRPIRTRAEYDAYVKRRDEEMQSEELSRMGTDRETLNRLVSELPEVKAMRKQLADAENERNEARRTAFEKKMSEEMRDIAALSPRFDSLEKILSGEHGGEFRTYVEQNGLSFLDAFRLAYGKEIESEKVQKRADAGRVKRESKMHLTSSETRGGGFDELPDEETLSLYRRMNPGMSDEDIRKNYSRIVKTYFPKRK